MAGASSPNTVAKGNALLMPNRQGDSLVSLAAKLPGVVIFLHGVNDPGATYEKVEKGYCQGLNERLDRHDLMPGHYGAKYLAAKAQWQAQNGKAGRKQDDVLRNPDANLYKRSETKGKTHSPFIPFYWGYRAAKDEIAKDPKTDTPLTMRGQYQDLVGNRLDQQFAKEGGFFSNATNNIPDMYGSRFRAPWLGKKATEYGLSGRYSYVADAPLRHYFVLAAHRLAMLVRTIRQVKPVGDKSPANDTITIMGHSQGSIIALLAQAILAQDGQRCADCLIMVDSPYGVHEESPLNGDEKPRVQTSQAKVQTLINIVNAVTAKPHSIPQLADLLIGATENKGRTGALWKPTQGQRPGAQDKKLIPFVERDNRGKVYCYFCPEDTVVALSNIHGIGTFGVPDELEVKWTNARALVANLQAGHQPSSQLPAGSKPSVKQSEKLAVMNVLKNMRFYQRMWTRLQRFDSSTNSFRPIPVGLPPGKAKVREAAQRRSVGPDDAVNLLQGAATQDRHEFGAERLINAEALSPTYVPDMYGGEVVKGGQKTGELDKAGKMAPDDVAVDVALGNRHASFEWFAIGGISLLDQSQALKTEFNANKQAEDQTQTVRAISIGRSGAEVSYRFEREETPNEARLRMASDPSAWSDNSYHSGILNASENQRWVSAMDMAIGQAVVLDDPDWRSLLLLMADWRHEDTQFKKLKGNPCYAKLDDKAKHLLEATKLYFLKGIFPSENDVPKTFPSLVVSETVAQRANRQDARSQQNTRHGAEGSW